MSIIDDLDQFTKIPINKGFSKDCKYKINKGEYYYLLRELSIKKEATKKLEVKYGKYFKELKINHAELVEVKFGKETIRSIYQWVEGEDLKNYKGKLDSDKLYQLGIQAGHSLKKIHSIPIERGATNWETSFNLKIDKKIAAYEKGKSLYPKGQ